MAVEKTRVWHGEVPVRVTQMNIFCLCRRFEAIVGALAADAAAVPLYWIYDSEKIDKIVKVELLCVLRCLYHDAIHQRSQAFSSFAQVLEAVKQYLLFWYELLSPS
jgi:hypothetical protein